MDSSSITIIIVLVLLLALSAYFSSTETAYSSMNRIRLMNMADEGDKKAVRALRLSENYDRILSTILIGNNIVNILMATLATILFVDFMGDQSAGATMSTVVVTVVVLLFGEISPKSMAKEQPEKLAIHAGGLLSFFVILLTPLNWFFAQWKKLLAKMFHLEADEGISEEELLSYVDVAQQEGGIDEQEGELIRNVIEFNDTEVEEILTPRVRLAAVDLDEDSVDDIAEMFLTSGFSRLPVYHESADEIFGVINVKDFYTKVYNREGKIEDIIAPIDCVPQGMKISKLLNKLQEKNCHMVTVADEYGGIIGIVTLEDVLEELVGEIWDEHDEVVEDFIPMGEDEYRVTGRANLGDMFELFDMDYDDYDLDITTVGGWAMDQLDQIPEEGDSFEFDHLSAVVTKADGRKADELIVKKLPPEEEEK